MDKKQTLLPVQASLAGVPSSDLPTLPAVSATPFHSLGHPIADGKHPVFDANTLLQILLRTNILI